MNADVVWQGVGANVAGAVISGVVAVLSALWVVHLTNRGAAQNARQERLEAAVADLILAVTGLYGLEHSWSDERWHAARAQWFPVFEQARVRVLLLTDSEELDEQLRNVASQWEEHWRELLDYAGHMRGELLIIRMEEDVPDEEQPEDGLRFDREWKWLESRPVELVRRLRELETPTPEHARKLANSLGRWRAEMNDLEKKYGNAPAVHYYESRGHPPPPYLR